LIILSGVSQNTSLYDPSNNTIAAGPATGALMGPNSVTCFPIASGANAGKFIATQGAITPTTATRIYDPATNTFAAGPNLATNIAAGSFAIPITIGTNSGKVLLFIGGTTTNLYDPATHTFSVGPNLSASATGGAYLLLTVGANKDKYWILHGNTSSIYDPNTNSITAGVALPDGGTMAFNLTSGLFNQGVLVVTGSGNLTSILYP
jgi:hypothetical protein